MIESEDVFVLDVIVKERTKKQQKVPAKKGFNSSALV
jgi:hypothetical protein